MTLASDEMVALMNCYVLWFPRVGSEKDFRRPTNIHGTLIAHIVYVDSHVQMHDTRSWMHAILSKCVEEISDGLG
jgi:hypothetical protein